MKVVHEGHLANIKYVEIRTVRGRKQKNPHSDVHTRSSKPLSSRAQHATAWLCRPKHSKQQRETKSFTMLATKSNRISSPIQRSNLFKGTNSRCFSTNTTTSKSHRVKPKTQDSSYTAVSKPKQPPPSPSPYGISVSWDHGVHASLHQDASSTHKRSEPQDTDAGKQKEQDELIILETSEPQNQVTNKSEQGEPSILGTSYSHAHDYDAANRSMCGTPITYGRSETRDLDAFNSTEKDNPSISEVSKSQDHAAVQTSEMQEMQDVHTETQGDMLHTDADIVHGAEHLTCEMQNKKI